MVEFFNAILADAMETKTLPPEEFRVVYSLRAAGFWPNPAA